MRIALFEAYFTGSHQVWAEGLKKHSAHTVTLFTLPGRHWKWRLHGSAVTFAQLINQQSQRFDLFLVTSMTDLTTFMALLDQRHRDTACVYYFHENQLTYPWSPDDPDAALGRDFHYGFIQIASALAATRCWFNSSYHQEAFISAAASYLKRLPDFQLNDAPVKIGEKSTTVPLGLDLIDLFSKTPLTPPPFQTEEPVLLWNHRWEYDKAPDLFFSTLTDLALEGVPFKVAITGSSFSTVPEAFTAALSALADRIVHIGYCEDRYAYASIISCCDYLPVTSLHDFFGISVVEAAFGGVLPLLPQRLAYRDHFDDPQLFYDDGTFVNRLREMLQAGKPQARYNGAALARYDWTKMRWHYDTMIEDICN